MREQQLKLPDGRFKIASAVREPAAADHQEFQVRIIPLAGMDIAPVCLRHGHGGQGQHTVNEILQPGRTGAP